MPSSLAIQCLSRIPGTPESATPGMTSAAILPFSRRESTAWELRPDPLDMGLDQLHQLLDHIDIEREPGAGSAIDLGKGPDCSDRQSLTITSHGLAGVVQTVAPDLERAQLGDPVFDVVEG